MPIPARPEKPTLWNSLKDNFDSLTFTEKVRELNLPYPTASKWLKEWIQKGEVEKKVSPKGSGYANYYFYRKINKQINS